MYDELIKNLRGRSQFLLPHYGEETSYDSDLMKQAADAIEELSKKRDAACWGCKCEKIEPSVWIPVTERLPEQKKAHYLCLLDDDSMAVVYWSKIPDWASKGEWTWHNPNWKEVTHWMPLPTPPKEE